MKINKDKLRVPVYCLIVGGLALTGLIFYGVSQYQKAMCNASKVVLAGAESQLSMIDLSADSPELKEDKRAWYTEIATEFTAINEENSKKYKASAVVAYTITTLALVSFGLCLKHADSVKEKEDK